MATDFDKEFFQRSWGPEGYYETFSYGVGITQVISTCCSPFYDPNKTALEIGPGGGAFTEKIRGRFLYLTAIDVIKMPDKFFNYRNFRFIELEDKDYNCTGVDDNSIDFCFCYNTFCHLSNKALKQYLISVHRVLKIGGDFIFMLANYEHSKKQQRKKFKCGELMPFGHFAQDHSTLGIISGEGWEVVNSNMIPEHRDLLIHLKKI